MTIWKPFFWSGAAAATWVLVGYPLTLMALPRRPWLTDDAEPDVTIIIPAFREREALRAKLIALDDLDYPREHLQVLVVADEDPELVAIAQQARPDATVSFSATRGGKAAGLNRGLAAATGDVVVMTDANNVLERDSIRAAVRHFADPGVWAVAGRRGEADSAYDRYEEAIRSLESRSGSVAAMSGEFMVVRRERLPLFGEGVVNDDFWLLCRIVRDGGRVVYEPRAASIEPALEAEAEMARRSRMGAGRVGAMRELRDLPTGFAWRVLSHKFGRLGLPIFLAQALLGSLALSRRPAYRAALVTQAGGYAAGCLSLVGVRPPGVAGRLFRAAGQFTLGNVAVGVGLIRGLRGRQGVIWTPVR